jgi:hypothetical protein
MPLTKEISTPLKYPKEFSSKKILSGQSHFFRCVLPTLFPSLSNQIITNIPNEIDLRRKAVSLFCLA